MTNWMRSIRLSSLWLVAFPWFVLVPAASAVVGVDWVTVSDPGNACDVQVDGCFGLVAESYRISKFEVTNAQYAEFLNAVAATDTNTLLIGAIRSSAARPVACGAGIPSTSARASSQRRSGSSSARRTKASTSVFASRVLFPHRHRYRP